MSAKKGITIQTNKQKDMQRKIQKMCKGESRPGLHHSTSSSALVARQPTSQVSSEYLVSLFIFSPNYGTRWVHILSFFIIFPPQLWQDERRATSFHGNSRSQPRKTSLLKVSSSRTEIVFLDSSTYNYCEYDELMISNNWFSSQVASILSFSQFLENSKETYI